MATKLVLAHGWGKGEIPYLKHRDSLFYDLQADGLLHSLGTGVYIELE